MKQFFIFIFVFILFYILNTLFIIWSTFSLSYINPANWTQDGRTLSMICVLFISLLITTYLKHDKD